MSTVNSSSPDNSYYSGQSYESYGGPTIILNGKFYYSVGTNPREGWYVVTCTVEKQSTSETIHGAVIRCRRIIQSSTGSIPRCTSIRASLDL